MSNFKDRFDQFFNVWSRDYIRTSSRIAWMIAIVAALLLIAYYILLPDSVFDTVGLFFIFLVWFLVSIFILTITDFLFGMPLFARDYMNSVKDETRSRQYVIFIRNRMLRSFMTLNDFRYMLIGVIILFMLLLANMVTTDPYFFSPFIIGFALWIFCLSCGLLAASFLRYPIASILVFIFWFIPGVIISLDAPLIEIHVRNAIFNVQFQEWLPSVNEPGLRIGDLYYLYSEVHWPRVNLGLHSGLIPTTLFLLSLITLFVASMIMNRKFASAQSSG